MRDSRNDGLIEGGRKNVEETIHAEKGGSFDNIPGSNAFIENSHFIPIAWWWSFSIFHLLALICFLGIFIFRALPPSLSFCLTLPLASFFALLRLLLLRCSVPHFLSARNKCFIELKKIRSFDQNGLKRSNCHFNWVCRKILHVNRYEMVLICIHHHDAKK